MTMTDSQALAAIDEAIRITDRKTDWMDSLKAAREHIAARLRESAEAQRCTCPSGDGSLRWPCPAHPAKAQAQGGGEALEAELIALVAGPYHYHHKMDEHAEREGKAFDRCRELTIQNIRTWCATRRAMLAAQPPIAPVGDSLVQTALRNLPQYISKSGLVGPDKHSAMQCFEVLRAALAQQPASDGGFTAADMMDARQEGRNEARQPAAVDGALELVRDIAEQKPEKPDYWSSCSQCERNIDLAQEVLAAQPGGSHG